MTKREHPWRGLHWLMLSAFASGVAKVAMDVCYWAWQRERISRGER
ncbi:MAG TPA: hypothetical protein VGQ44_17170 [Gemmatimonadaceae bacterium]|jgi:hypothetical protein|nr:hypothetical protein [Gemmatimonadaceae bacterium]